MGLESVAKFVVISPTFLPRVQESDVIVIRLNRRASSRRARGAPGQPPSPFLLFFSRPFAAGNAAPARSIRCADATLDFSHRISTAFLAFAGTAA